MNFFTRVKNKLKPAAWKSETHLNKKEGNRSKSEERKHGESIFYTKPLSKSSDWTEVDLEVPLKDDEHIHLRNPKLSLIFDNDKGTPTPPPRSKLQRSSNFKEKIEKMAKSSLQAIQGDKNNQNNQVSIEEPLIVKRQINYNCPLCDSDEKSHNRDHHHHDNVKKPAKEEATKFEKEDSLKKSKNDKRKKNLSVVSLPNYTDLKFSVADSDPLAPKTTSKSDLNSSRLSLQNASPKKITSSQSTGKLDTYITRCRSFGSILPQQLKKFMPQKPKPVDITSDDSFGALEDWDLGLIEHYNPKDASLPRPRKPIPQKPSDSKILSDIESLIVKEEDIEPQKPQKPKVPSRKSENVVKKINKDVSKANTTVSKPPEVLTPPPSPVSPKESSKVSNTISIFEREFPANVEKTAKKEGFSNKVPYQNKLCTNTDETIVKTIVEPAKTTVESSKTIVEPPKTVAVPEKALPINKKEDRNSVEHSSLMRILQEFSVKDKQQEKPTNVGNDSNFSSLTPSLVEFEKNLNNSLVEDFINAEKSHTRAVTS